MTSRAPDATEVAEAPVNPLRSLVFRKMRVVKEKDGTRWTAGQPRPKAPHEEADGTVVIGIDFVPADPPTVMRVPVVDTDGDELVEPADEDDEDDEEEPIMKDIVINDPAGDVYEVIGLPDMDRIAADEVPQARVGTIRREDVAYFEEVIDFATAKAILIERGWLGAGPPPGEEVVAPGEGDAPPAAAADPGLLDPPNLAAPGQGDNAADATAGGGAPAPG